MGNGKGGYGITLDGNQVRLNQSYMGSKISFAPELLQMQPFSLYLDWAKCNLDKSANTACIYTDCKSVAHSVKPELLCSGRTLDAGLDCRGRAISVGRQIPGPSDEWFVPNISHSASRGRLTPQSQSWLQIGSISTRETMEPML